MVENLTNDALDVIVDVVMETSRRLYGRLRGARRYWLDITADFWYEWCDRHTDWYPTRDGSNATITP